MCYNNNAAYDRINAITLARISSHKAFVVRGLARAHVGTTQSFDLRGRVPFVRRQYAVLAFISFISSARDLTPTCTPPPRQLQNNIPLNNTDLGVLFLRTRSVTGAACTPRLARGRVQNISTPKRVLKRFYFFILHLFPYTLKNLCGEILDRWMSLKTSRAQWNNKCRYRQRSKKKKQKKI